MLQQLEQLRGQLLFALTIVDVDTSQALRTRYGSLVPVLEDARGRELCRYFLDLERLIRYLDAPGSDTMSG
jgi:hypothetical protein